ncbi:unnamed protein product, partial [Brugia timori]|uniref:Uncharacterized protein n=1 Tax=Brugia timori TaxID=42155 RepID=A0A0R3QGH6_9BILA
MLLEVAAPRRGRAYGRSHLGVPRPLGAEACPSEHSRRPPDDVPYPEAPRLHETQRHAVRFTDGE